MCKSHLPTDLNAFTSVSSDEVPQELGAYAAAVALQDVLRPPADSLYARLAARAPDFFDAADADDTSTSDSDDEALCPSGLAGWCKVPAFKFVLSLSFLIAPAPNVAPWLVCIRILPLASVHARAAGVMSESCARGVQNNGLLTWAPKCSTCCTCVLAGLRMR